MLIYEPKGKAREYSPLALNIYNGCDHACEYCYLKKISNMLGSNEPVPKKDLLLKLSKELDKTGSGIRKQVLLSFSGDPYCIENDTQKLTRFVLELLLKHDIPTAILSKGGNRVMQDADLFESFDQIKIGQTLTFQNEADRLKWEPGSASTNERLGVLESLSQLGIKTFVSFEPVIDPAQTLALLEIVSGFVHHVKIGKINHYAEIDKSIDWNRFGSMALDIVRRSEVKSYFKKDLRSFMDDGLFSDDEKNQDFLSLKRSVPVINKVYSQGLLFA